MLRTSLAVSFAVSCGLAFAACGGGGGEAPAPTTPTAPAASEAPSAPPAETKTEPVASASAAPAASSAPAASAPATPPPDSAAQVAAGEKAYGASCAMCHGKKGEGKGKNPKVVGPKALDDQHNAKELFDYIKMNMPPKKPGSLSDDDTWAVTAWLLDKNGLLKGQGLNAGTSTSVTWKR